MRQSKIIVESYILDAISNSTELNISEKISFLKYIWYMSISERAELIRII